MTLEELKNFCEGEFGNLDTVSGELFSVCRDDKPDYTLAEKAAASAFVVNIYSGIENILKQLLIYDRLDISDSPSWHEKVLKKAGEIGILPPDLIQKLSGYLAFRNYFIYAYIFNVRWDETLNLVRSLPDVLTRFKDEVRDYLQSM